MVEVGSNLQETPSPGSQRVRLVPAWGGWGGGRPAQRRHPGESRRGGSIVAGPGPWRDRPGGSQREAGRRPPPPFAAPHPQPRSLTFEKALQRLRLVHHLHVRPARRALRPGPATARPGGAASPARPARQSRLGSGCGPARPASALAPRAALARPPPAPRAPPAAPCAPCRPGPRCSPAAGGAAGSYRGWGARAGRAGAGWRGPRPRPAP